uniref:Uncharacterized protein n=1 Tax=Oryza punctata TaxID=4537 RepID=A0A0E0KPQ6_ORYPU
MEGETLRARRRCRPVLAAAAACAPFIVLLLLTSAAAAAAAAGEAVVAWRTTTVEDTVEVEALPAELGMLIHRRVWSSKEHPGSKALSRDGGVCVQNCGAKVPGDPYTLKEHCNHKYYNRGC